MRPSFLEPLNRLVERAGPQTDRAAGAFLDVLFDGVAVPIPVRQGEQDVDDRQGQGLPGSGIGGFRHKRIVRRYVYAEVYFVQAGSSAG